MQCNPETVFHELNGLAKHTVDAYDRQLRGEHFRFEDIDGISFRINRLRIDTTRDVSIALSGFDLSAIRVVSNKFAARQPVKYAFSWINLARASSNGRATTNFSTSVRC
jgi:hypothetical protein